MSQTFTLADVAGLLSVSRATVNDWLSRGCPYIEKADQSQAKGWKLSLPDVVSWLRKRDVDQAIGDTSKWDIDEARLRKTAAEAALAELELSKQRGEVISLGVVSEIFAEQLSACRSRLLSLPTKCAPLVSPLVEVLECRDVLDAAVREALNELVGYARGGGSGEADSEGGADAPDRTQNAAAANPHRKRVGRPRKTPLS